MSQKALTKLNTLATLSEAMLLQAEQGNWEELEHLEVQRQENLPDFSNSQLTQEQYQIISTALERIVQINGLIADLSASERDSQRKENRKMATGKRAVNAYNSAV